MINVYKTTRRYIIALMMEAARTSETLVNFYQTTRRYNPEDSHQDKCYLKIKWLERKQPWPISRYCLVYAWSD
jgi:hypothetical protein